VIIPDENFSMIKVDDVTDSEFVSALNETINLLFI